MLRAMSFAVSLGRVDFTVVLNDTEYLIATFSEFF
jgi:hypothetical protein